MSLQIFKLSRSVDSINFNKNYKNHKAKSHLVDQQYSYTNLKNQMQQNNETFRIQQQNTMKTLISQLRDSYFTFLSSLKFQNIADKKHAKDYKNISHHGIQQQHDRDRQGQPDAMTLNNIMTTKYNFQDQMLIQNKGYLAMINLLEKIQRLKEFNVNLSVQLMCSAPYVGQDNISRNSHVSKSKNNNNHN